MKKSFLWRQFAILGLGFIGLNVLTKLFVHGASPHRKVNSIQTHPRPTHIFLGNSVVEVGVRPKVIQREIPLSRPLNLGMGGAASEDSYLLFQAVKTSAEDKPRVYVGFFDRQLTDYAPQTWTDLKGNRTTCYLTNLDEAVRILAPDNPVLAWQMRLTALSPILIERATLWNRVELLRRQVGEIGLPKKAVNNFGRVEDFSGLEENDVAGFAVKCQRAITENTPFNPAIREIIQHAKKAGLTTYFISMPMPSLHRRRYYNTPQWERYQRYLQKLSIQAGAQYIDASAWVPDTVFSDHVHMKPAGGEIFTRKLVAYMK